MRAGITGASGLIGGAIAREASERGWDVVGYSRDPGKEIPHVGEVRRFSEDGALDLSGVDALVHLAGESIFGLWTKRRKRAMRDSRVIPTRGIAERIRAGDTDRPRVFVCGSAAGIYGDRGDEILDESSAPGAGFLAEVVREWEEAAERAAGERTRVVRLRFGMVLGRDGGAAPLMKDVFRFGVGGTLGSGEQWTPWIHVSDAARLAVHAIENDSIRGPINAVSPGWVRNREFTKAAAETLNRPALLRAPAAALRLLPGGMHEMFLSSQLVQPKAAADAGFEFRFPDARSAFADVFG